jgi:hypothetical protein
MENVFLKSGSTPSWTDVNQQAKVGTWPVGCHFIAVQGKFWMKEPDLERAKEAAYPSVPISSALWAGQLLRSLDSPSLTIPE